MMRKLATITAAIAFASLTAATSYAAQISDTANFSFPLSPATQTVQLDKFDTSMGTLNWVLLEIEGTVTANVTAENKSSLAAPNASLNLTANFTANAPASTTAIVALADSQSASLDPADSNPGEGGDYKDFGLISVTDSNQTFVVINKAAFEGTGQFDVEVVGNAGFVVSGTTDSTLNISNLAGAGLVKVTYDYNAIPEPASMALIGLGAVAIFSGRRRR